MRVKVEMHLPEELILSKIYRLRNYKVMIDRDLAQLYGIPTKVLKQAVRRNLDRFPEDFMFQMTPEELEIWRSQFVTSKEDLKGLRHAPFCFTEQGVTMLSCVLKSPQAIAVNIQIIRTFVKMREVLLSQQELALQIEELRQEVGEHDLKIEKIFEAILSLAAEKEKPRAPIGFKPS